MNKTTPVGESKAEPEVMWRALSERRYLLDVVYAVRSTGIYCRTDCPSRRPSASQVSFFRSVAEAEGAGYRPCSRCRPQDAAQEAADLNRVQAFLDSAESVTDLTLGALAERFGLEPRYLTRLFRREMGVTPRTYAEARRTERLRTHLRGDASVTEALYAAGYGSSRALYASADRALGMTPGAYRKGGAGACRRYRTQGLCAPFW